jgi:hypothetical protein
MAERVYENFDLEIKAVPGVATYEAKVLDSPDGQTSQWIPVQIPPPPAGAAELLVGAAGATHASRDAATPRTRVPGGPDAQALKKYGRDLFAAAFVGEIAKRWAVSVERTRQARHGLRLRLRLTDAPELAKFPWEFLYADPPRAFLALSQWTPVVRFLDVPGSARSLAVEPPLRILVFTALPRDLGLLDVESEIAQLREAVADLERFSRVQVRYASSGRYAELQKALSEDEYHVLHFIGHGGYDQEATEGTLALVGENGATDEVSADDFAYLLAELDHSPRLVVLNACRGAEGDRLNVFASTAGKLLDRGIPAVVAMQYPITDRGATVFGGRMYRALAQGVPLDAAISEARFFIKRATGSLEWATPVLYLRAPDGRIFDVAHAPTATGGRTTYPHTGAQRLARIVMESPMVGSPADRAALMRSVAGEADPSKTFEFWVADTIARGHTQGLLAALQARAADEEQLLAVEAVSQGWRRLDWISQPLETLDGKVDFQDFLTAFDRAVPPGAVPSGIAPRPDSLAGALDAAAQFSLEKTRDCPLYKLVAMLEQRAGVQIDAGWFELENDQLSGLREDAKRWVEAAPGRLVIDLRSGGTPPGLPSWPTTVIAHLYHRLADGWSWERLKDQQCESSLEGVKAAVNVHIEVAREAELSSFEIGFVLPRLLFSSMPERWPVPMLFDDPSPVALEHPVVLHSAERMTRHELHRKWASRTDQVRARLASGPADIGWLDMALRDNSPALRQEVARLLTTVIALGFVPRAAPASLNGDALLAAVGAGVPYVLWVEDEPLDWAEVRTRVASLVGGGSADSLAERLHDDRVRSRDPLAGGVRLIWDDPMRLPESLRPSRAPGDTMGV